MGRLSDRAYRQLKVAIESHCRSKNISGARRDLALLRLEKLRRSAGSPASYRELRAIVEDILPDFEEATLRSAAKANRSPQAARAATLLGWGTGGAIALTLLGFTGFVALANTPFPPVRRFVADKAPVLLLPSFFQMDAAYRGAIAAVEQADQLVDKATTPADLALGRTKVAEAQKHLDRLPVWALGYEPQRMCGLWGGCQFKFTLDEFENARKWIARLEARLFQEDNAQKAYLAAETAAQAAKQQHRTNPNGPEGTAAIAAWQAAIDTLRTIPPETLAGKQAIAKVQAHERDFQAAAGYALGNEKVGTAIAAAKEFANRAAQATQSPPHPAEVWQNSADLWRAAIAELERIKPDDPDYVGSRRLLATYADNLGQIQGRLQQEKTAVQALDRAKTLIARWRSSAAADNTNPALLGDLQEIINQLDQVKPGTSATQEAEELRKFAQAKLTSP